MKVALSTFFITLPEPVVGSSLTMWTAVGDLYSASWDWHQAISCWGVTGVEEGLRSTMAACTISPMTELGMPKTAAWRT